MLENALTVDVEDYFHVSAFSKSINPANWDQYECRVEQNTNKLLGLFDEHNTKATFFVLGWVAERYPQLVRDIASEGHEIACHGYSHQLVYNQTPEIFREETSKSKALLEDQAQKPVNGYRAASYSITNDSLWALDTLLDLGFVYDSSIFPIHHDRYGIPGAPRKPYMIQAPGGGSLAEFPLSTRKVMGYRLPVSGGGYFRLFPYWFTRSALRAVNMKESLPFIFYLHPWEIDPKQPRVSAGVMSRFRHYNNLYKCEGRLRRLLSDFKFSSAYHVLKKMDGLEII
jgi:polysaccharide deacetylase family protein (PEP-CTERM system associated)